MIKDVSVKCVAVKDAYGDVSHAVFEDWSDGIFITGDDGDGVCVFESEAYHLSVWCEVHGFTLYTGEEVVEFDLELQ